MKFRVTRVSVWDDAVKPCENAIQEPRTILDFQRQPKVLLDWYVEIPTLEALLQFIEENGSIILHGTELKICDDYCE